MEEKKVLAEIHLKATDLGDGGNVEVSVHSKGKLKYQLFLVAKYIIKTEHNIGTDHHFQIRQISRLVDLLPKEKSNEN